MDTHQDLVRNTTLAREAATLALGSMILALFAGCWRAAAHPHPVPAAAPDPLAAPVPLAPPGAMPSQGFLVDGLAEGGLGSLRR